MRILSIDVETLGAVDIKSAGGYRYAETCTLLLFGYAYDDDPVQVVDMARGEEIPRSVLSDLTNPDVLKVAYNAQFERTVLTHYCRGQGLIGADEWLDARQWLCTMVLGLTLGLPGNLAGLGEAMGLREDERKMAIGKTLIRKFCIKGRGFKTPEEDPENWSLFIDYNRRDVETERTLRKKLWKYRPNKFEQDLWALDQRINDRGVMIDTVMVKAAIKVDEAIKADVKAQAQELTGLDNPASGQQLKLWIQANEGLMEPPASLTKDTIPEIMKVAKKESTKEALRLKLQLGKTSTKKYQAMLDALCDDGKVHGLLQFYGASRTGRWAGRLVQVQNLPRGYIDDIGAARDLLKQGDRELFEFVYEDVPATLSQLIRSAFVASPGGRFIDCDFSAIEARVIAWLAGEKWRQEVFAEGGDIYCMSASQMFGVPVTKHGENGHLRQKGKVAELACGYGGGLGAMKAMGADKMGLSDEEIKDIVNRWREKSPNMPTYSPVVIVCGTKSLSMTGAPSRMSGSEAVRPERQRYWSFLSFKSRSLVTVSGWKSQFARERYALLSDRFALMTSSAARAVALAAVKSAEAGMPFSEAANSPRGCPLPEPLMIPFSSAACIL